ncbi:MAG: flavodoxin family protein [Candidatus Riflebacteria bacterium]|nr:flavodoxin family protein [Candidatus Riflebacteria bacterium]
MKVLAINGSARKDGNTAILIGHVFKQLQAEGLETEMVQLAGRKIRGCTACFKCCASKDRRCAVGDDVINDLIEKMLAADGIILGSPTYFTDVTAEMKALIDRAGFVARSNQDMFARKVGAAVIAVRRGGAIHAFDTINHFFLISQMIIPGSSYWNIGMGREKGEVENDQEGLKTMEVLGKNMAWLLEKLHG